MHEGDDLKEVGRLTERNIKTTTGTSASMSDSDYMAKLERVAISKGDLLLELGPADALQVLEVEIYASTATLATGPILGGECTTKCGSDAIETEMVRNIRTLHIDRDAVDVGNVVILVAFVNAPQETGVVSWGIELVHWSDR